MKKEEKENIKVYIRTENRIYAFVEDEIILYEDEELSEVLENLKTDYFWGENEVEAIVILHFSYFIFNENEKNIKNNNINFLKNLLSYRKEKFYMNFTENLFMDIFLEKREIKRIKDTFRKYGWKLCKIKTDFDCLYNYFKDRNMEILQLGEKESIRFVIEDRKISEIEKLELKIEDLGNVDEFDFGDMKVIEVEEENIKSIFMGEELFESPNFIGKSQINLNMNKITVKDILSKDRLDAEFYLSDVQDNLKKLNNLSNRSIMSSGRTAIVVVHGMGNQPPLSTISEFVEKFEKRES